MMLQFTWSEKNSNDIWQWPATETTSLAGQKHPLKLGEAEEEEGLQKRSKWSSAETTNQWSLISNEFPIAPSHLDLLNEPSPLGLTLKKSPSLLELIQMKLAQEYNDKGASRVEKNIEVGKKRTRHRSDKLKASNFPALLLKIGPWQYVSKYEGDLVVKCYFTKHKLVWEFLDDGLKKKMEIHWAKIVAIKADLPDKGPGGLTIVLGKPPHFYKETDPQPKKHTVWQLSSDFTDGAAITYRRHFLQCEQGMLKKHYEKLIQSDVRLNSLSNQPDAFLQYPYFVAADFVNELLEPSEPENSKGSSLGLLNMVSPPTSHPSPSTTEELAPLNLVNEDMPQATHFTTSEHGYRGSYGLEGLQNTEQLKAAEVQPTMPMSNPVSHIGLCTSDQGHFGNLPFPDNGLIHENPKDMYESFAQIMMSDTPSSAASDEETIMLTVNSLSSLLRTENMQHDGNEGFTPDCYLTIENEMEQNDTSPGEDNWQNIGNDGFIPDCGLMPENEIKESDMDRGEDNGQYNGNDGSTPGSDLTPENDSGSMQAAGMTRKDSFTDLVHQLPRIASLPEFLFDMSENGDIMNYL